MTQFNWSTLTNGQTLTFNPNADVLHFDDPAILATSIGYNFAASNSGTFTFALDGKSVTLSTPFASLTTTNLTFASGTLFLVGDNTTAVAGSGTNDDATNTLTGTAGDDQFVGLGGADILNGGDGNDSFATAFNNSNFGNDIVDGGNGIDTLAFGSGSPNAIIASMATHLAGNASQGTISFTNIETIFGTNAGDTFTGGDLSHASNAEPLGNTVTERFRGNGGSDTINGGADFFVSGRRVVYFTIADYSNNSNAQVVTANLQTGSVSDGRGFTDTLTNVDGLRGGAGNDSLLGGSQSRSSNGIFFELFRGNAGNDTINGNNATSGGDVSSSDRADYGNNTAVQAITVDMTAGTVLDGLGGTDTLISINQVYGGSGNDIFNASAEGDAAFDGGTGNDTFNGSTGIDEVRYRQSTAGVTVNLSASSVTFNSVTVAANSANDGMGGTDTLNNIEVVRGSDFADYMRGSDSLMVVEVFSGNGGNDTIDGGAGTDYVSYATNALSLGGITATLSNGAGTINDGMGGTDTVTNIEGIAGTNSNDTLTGGLGVQWLRGSGGSDTLNGGDGDDWVDYSTSPSAVTINLAAQTATDGYNGPGGVLALGGTDTLISIENAQGSYFDDTITGSNVANILKGGDGNDTLNGGDGVDTLDGGNGTDTVTYAGASNGITARLDLGFGVDQGGAFDTYAGVENIIGTSLNDVLAGVAGIANTLTGGDGDDTFYGEGIDVIAGDNGSDTFFTGAGAALNMNVTTAGVETVWGGFLADTMNGSSAAGNLTLIGQGPTADTMSGGFGNDFIYYRAGDVISGGMGSDWAVATFSLTGVNLGMNAAGFENAWGSTSGDTISAAGAAAGVAIVGDAGNDIITGGNSGDFLYGFGDNDTIKGGLGNDIIDGGAGNDTLIYDAAAFGTDLVYNFAAGQDKINMAGSGVNAFAQLTITVNGGNSVITSAATGSSEIWVLGVTGLAAGDFLFV